VTTVFYRPDSLWLIAAVEMTISAGMFLAAGVAKVIILVIFIVLDKFEKWFFQSDYGTNCWK
jgi:uncharacterized membrane protein YhiD involved in acid resistance